MITPRSLLHILDLFQNNGEYGLGIVGGASDWTNIIIPGDLSTANEFHHQKTFELGNLVENVQYECLVQAKNR